MDAEVFILLSMLGLLLFFVGIVYWLAFAGPQKERERLLKRAPELDRSIPQFYGLSPSWSTYRLLPSKGIKTVWELQTSEGEDIGCITISTYINRPGAGHPVVVRGRTFRFRKNIEGFIQDGFVIETETQKLYLRRDKGFGVLSTLKKSFKNLELVNEGSVITVRGRAKRTISLSRNGKEVGVGTHLNGFYPGLAIVSGEASELELAILFYCMNLH